MQTHTHTQAFSWQATAQSSHSNAVDKPSPGSRFTSLGEMSESAGIHLWQATQFTEVFSPFVHPSVHPAFISSASGAGGIFFVTCSWDCGAGGRVGWPPIAGSIPPALPTQSISWCMLWVWMMMVAGIYLKLSGLKSRQDKEHLTLWDAWIFSKRRFSFVPAEALEDQQHIRFPKCFSISGGCFQPGPKDY